MTNGTASTGRASVRLTPEERAELEAALAADGHARRRRRYQAILLLGQGQTAAHVAAALGCSVASVYSWSDIWRRGRVAGLRGRRHGGGKRLLDTEGERALTDLLASPPESQGYRDAAWTVPLLRRALARAGFDAGERTIRRALHRLDWHWESSRYVQGPGKDL